LITTTITKPVFEEDLVAVLTSPLAVVRPACASVEAKHQMVDHVTSQKEKLPSVSKRILLVEDHDVCQQVAGGMLRKLGFTVVVAGDGAEAIATVEREAARGKYFDIILMDVQMPKMNGIEATHIIRKNEQRMGRPRTPIIGVTAYTSKCALAGMDDFISKPLTTTKLQVVLGKFIETNVRAARSPRSVRSPGTKPRTAASRLSASSPRISPSRMSPSIVAKRRSSLSGSPILPRAAQLQAEATSADTSSHSQQFLPITSSSVARRRNSVGGSPNSLRTSIPLPDTTSSATQTDWPSPKASQPQTDRDSLTKTIDSPAVASSVVLVDSTSSADSPVVVTSSDVASDGSKGSGSWVIV
jgi:CheY-like chemotaxis protein